MKVLVVDDSRVMRQIVIRTLRQAGYGSCQVTEAENGLEATQKASSEKFDVILSDWNMPEMTGIEALQSLRAQGNDTTYGFVTSEVSQDMKDKAASAGASFFITKPFNAETFQDTLGPVIGPPR